MDTVNHHSEGACLICGNRDSLWVLCQERGLFDRMHRWVITLFMQWRTRVCVMDPGPPEMAQETANRIQSDDATPSFEVIVA